MKIIDLSKTIQYNAGDPFFMKVKIKHKPHRKAKWLIRYLGLPFRLFPKNFIGWADDSIQQMGVHATTHLDAPWHYAPISEGKPAKTIDEVPLEWCLNPGVKLDFRHFEDGYVATAKDVEAELARIGHTLSPYEIVVVNTSAGEAYGRPDYVAKGCGMGREATLYLLERGVRVTGTDGWSWDAPFIHTMQKYAATGDAGLIWEGHKAGREIGYCHLEKLHNLEQLPPTGFVVSCFPVKVKAGSAGWTRAVAIIE